MPWFALSDSLFSLASLMTPKAVAPVPPVVTKHGNPDAKIINFEKEMIREAFQANTSIPAIGKMSFWVALNCFCTRFDFCKKSITEWDSSFRFVVLNRFSQVTRDESMKNDGHAIALARS